jgi:hypothetical protein
MMERKVICDLHLISVDFGREEERQPGNTFLAKRDGGGACARAGQQAAGGLLGGSFSRTRRLTSLTFEGQQMHWGDLDIDQDQIV